MREQRGRLTMPEHDLHIQLEYARRNGLGSGQRMPSVCHICGFTRTDKRHNGSCSVKAKAMFADVNLPKWRRKSATAIDRLLNTVEEYRDGK